MAKSVLPKGVQEVKFKDIILFANLVEWTDTRKPRLATHEYLKRDGALIETMGRAPFQVKMTLVFVGEDFVGQFAKLSNSIDKDPKGTLTHPLYGSMQVACLGLEGATLNTETGTNLYTVPISFVEDNVDKTTAINTNGVAAQQQSVENTTSKITLNITQYAAAAQALTNLVNAALSFSAGAANALQQSTLDSSLPSALELVNKLTASAKIAVNNDPLLQHPVIAFDMISDLELLLDSCNQLWNALSTARRPLVSYTLPIQMHVAALAVKLYGSQGRAQINQILTNNPGKIPNPSAIPAGLTLIVEQPTQAGV